MSHAVMRIEQDSLGDVPVPADKQLGIVTEDEFDRVVDPAKMVELT